MREDGLDHRLVPPGVADARGRAFIDVVARIRDAFALGRLDLYDFDQVDERLLPALVRALSVEDFVAEDMAPATVRRILKHHVALQERRGKVAGVKFGLSLVGMRADWVQWHQRTPKGTPNTHTVTVLADSALLSSASIFSPRDVNAAHRMISAMTRHSQDVEVRFARQQAVGQRVGVWLLTRETSNTLPLAPRDVLRQSGLRVGVAAHLFQRSNTLPRQAA